MKYKLHDSAMNIGGSLESFALLQTPNQCGPADSASNTLSIAGVLGEVSYQRVASCFPVTSHSWLVPPGHVQGKEHADDAALLS
ncbi:MAG TPA: hypothetical protein VIY29_13355 [Ktedonobacteraceae bacterium]